MSERWLFDAKHKKVVASDMQLATTLSKGYIKDISEFSLDGFEPPKVIHATIFSKELMV